MIQEETKDENIILDITENLKGVKNVIDKLIEKEEQKLKKIIDSLSDTEKAVKAYMENKNDYKRNL
jgi:flagellar biosynthesis chaperone FliJ